MRIKCQSNHNGRNQPQQNETIPRQFIMINNAITNHHNKPIPGSNPNLDWVTIPFASFNQILSILHCFDQQDSATEFTQPELLLLLLLYCTVLYWTPTLMLPWLLLQYLNDHQRPNRWLNDSAASCNQVNWWHMKCNFSFRFCFVLFHFVVFFLSLSKSIDCCELLKHFLSSFKSISSLLLFLSHPLCVCVCVFLFGQHFSGKEEEGWGWEGGGGEGWGNIKVCCQQVTQVSLKSWIAAVRSHLLVLFYITVTVPLEYIYMRVCECVCVCVYFFFSLSSFYHPSLPLPSPPPRPSSFSGSSLVPRAKLKNEFFSLPHPPFFLEKHDPGKPLRMLHSDFELRVFEIKVSSILVNFTFI